MFEAVRNWFEVRATIKKAQGLRYANSAVDIVIVGDKLKHIDEMLQIGQREYASTIMDGLIDRYPAEIAKLPAAVLVLLRLGRLDDAEVIAARGMKCNPDSRDFFRYYCDIADQREDLPERLRRWRSFRRRYPAFGLAFRMEAYALLASGEDAAAERLLAEGARLIDDDIGLAIDYVYRAIARRDWPEAIRRWAVVRDHYEHPMGVCGIASVLSEQGLYDQAEVELRAGRKLFPFDVQIVEDLAAVAQRRGDGDVALSQWAELRREAPHIGRAYLESARLLRARGDVTAADDLIIDGARRVQAPTDPELHAEFARLAELAGDWSEAARRWQEVRELFPNHAQAYYAGADALQRAGELDAAEQVLIVALELFPKQVVLHQQLAGLAEARGDLALAAERLRGAVAAEPDSWQLRSALARALERGGAVGEADAELAAAIALRPDDPNLCDEHAAMATRAGWADVAAERLARRRQKFGTEPGLARAEANLLREQGRPADAAAVLQDAFRHAPDNVDLLHDLGHLAVHEGDWATAEACWRGLLEQQPQHGWAHVHLAHALREQGCDAEAEAALQAAWTTHPEDFGIASAWAQLASEARNWQEARRRWALVADAFPTEGNPVWQQSVALRESGQLAEARALLLAGVERYPHQPSFLHDLARLAEHEHDWPQAEGWWRTFIVAQADVAGAHTGLAGALREQGRVAEANEVLEQALPAFTSDLQFHVNYAYHAVATGQHEAAAWRFALARKRFGVAPPLAVAQARWLQDRAGLKEAAALLAEAIACHPQAPELAREQREVQAALDAMHSDPPVNDLDVLIGPAITPRPLPRSPTYTWYINGWMLPRRLERNHGTSFLTMSCPDDFFAVRVGFANVLSTPWTIGRAILCASAACGDHINPTDAEGRVRPDAAWRPLTFAGGGKDRPEIVTDPAAPTRIVVAGSGVPTTDPQGGEPVWTWTDWVPCRSLAPDPETGMRVLMLRAYAPGDEMITYPHGGFEDYHLDRSAHRGFEYVCFGCGEDRITCPSQTQSDGWSVPDLLPRGLIYGSMFHAVQFITRHSVVQGFATGDSHHAGRFLRTAVTRIGAEYIGAVPFACANAAVGGLPSAKFFPRLDALFQAINPSYVVLPGWTYNDYPQPNPDPAAIDRRFFARLCEVAAGVRARGAVPVWLTPFPRNPADMTPPIIASWHWLREVIVAQRAAGEIVVDAAMLLGCSIAGRLTGSYRPEYTTDRVHPNEAGHDALGDLIQEALKRHLVIGPAAENALAAPLASSPEPPAPVPAHPPDFIAACAWAQEATEARDWPEARQRWSLLQYKFPAESHPLWQAGIALREAGHVAAARDLFLAGAERYPAASSFPHDLARLAEVEHDWPEAERWWRRFLELDAQPWWAHNALVRARLAQGARLDALAILQARYTGDEPADPHGMADAIELLGASLEPAMLPLIEQLESRLAPHVASAETAHIGLAYARAARFLEKFDDYRTRAEMLAARLPHEGFVRETLHSACELAPRDEDLRAASPNQVLLGGAARRGASDGFHETDWLCFESLGGGGTRGGCEFGLLQRSVGEPLSLLRWASIEPEQLAQALERRFEGLGNPATLSIETQGHYDWRAVETVYNIRMDHTHLDRQTVSRETAARQVLTRLKFLARKLIKDLGESEKIFLYRLGGGVPDEPMLQRLSRAMAAYGASRLLVVGEDAAVPDRIDYREPAPNLLLAVRPDTTSRHGLALEPRLPGWRQICEHALLWQRGVFRLPVRLPYPGSGNWAELFADGSEDISADFGIACIWARQATDARDWLEAQRRWALLRARFPAEPHALWQEGVALREAGALDDAAALWQKGSARFPRDTSFTHELARLAESRADWPAAECWWRAFLGIEPELWWAHTGLGNALSQQDRIEDAEDVLQAAQGRLPTEAAILLALARLAERRRDWPEAERRFARLAEHFPDAVDGLWGSAAALREQGRLDEAERQLREGAARHPRHGGFVHDMARLAETRGDWAAAEHHWRNFLALEPHFWWAHTSLAAALLMQHRAEDAEVVLRDARDALPDEIGVVIELAHLIERGAHWAEALELWTAVRERTPEDIRGHLHTAQALRALGRAAESEAVLQEAAELHPAEPHLLHDLARAAEWRQGWSEAATRWQDCIAHFPDEIDFYLRARAAAQRAGQGPLADSIAVAAAARFPDRSEFLAERAREAFAVGRFAAAAQDAALLRERFPDDIEGYLIGAEAVEALPDPAGAAAIIAAAEARMPGRPAWALVAGRQALRAHRWADAEHWFAEVRRREPGASDGWIGAVQALRGQGRFPDAERMIEDGMAALPNDLTLVLAHVEAPLETPYGRSREVESALARSRALCERAPGWEPGLVQRLRLLQEAGDYAQAEALAAASLAQLPGSGFLAAEHANISLRREDWPEAVRRFTRLRESFPDSPMGPVGLARALAWLERFAEAEAELEAAMARFPHDLDPFAEYAQVAVRRGVPAEAYRRWQAARARFPHVPWLAQKAFEAQLQMTETDDPSAVAIETVAGDAALLGAILLDFESLGGTWQGCEFGLVQRAAGIEPLGLLRWTEMNYESLVSLLEADLAGVGEVEHTELLIPDSKIGGEYATRDRRYMMQMHTFVTLKDMPPERMSNQVLRRLKYLREKLLDDLRNGAKIFTFKQSTRNLTVAEMERLHDAVCRLGPNTLLYTRTADAEHPNGTVVWHRAGLLIGYIDCFAQGPNQEHNGAQTQSWNAVCIAAHAMWKAAQGGRLRSNLPVS
jgi:predicted Zn-dependent protease